MSVKPKETEKEGTQLLQLQHSQYNQQYSAQNFGYLLVQPNMEHRQHCSASTAYNLGKKYLLHP